MKNKWNSINLFFVKEQDHKLRFMRRNKSLTPLAKMTKKLDDNDSNISEHQMRKRMLKTNLSDMIKLTGLAENLFWLIKVRAGMIRRLIYWYVLKGIIRAILRARIKQKKFGLTFWDITNNSSSNQKKLAFPYFQLFSYWWTVFSRKYQE